MSGLTHRLMLCGATMAVEDVGLWRMLDTKLVMISEAEAVAGSMLDVGQHKNTERVKKQRM